MSDSFFTRDGDWFRPTGHCRGPWDAEACHAGPPTGLLARAMEHALPDQRLCRITVELIRPIPFAGFRIVAQCTRQGRTVSTSEASLINDSGKALVVARGLHMTEQPLTEFPSHSASIGSPEQAIPGNFPIEETLHGLPAFNGSGVTVRYPEGQTNSPGPTTAWMKTVALLPDEAPSPFQRMCPLADCGNAFGRNADLQQVHFMNTDLTLSLHRDPEGEWLGTHSVGYWQANGIGLADATLYDARGAVGRALQTLLLKNNRV